MTAALPPPALRCRGRDNNKRVTTRDLGETGIKLLGIYFAVSALSGVLRVAAALLSPTMEEFSPHTGELVFISGAPVIGMVAIAIIFLRWGRAIAHTIFPDASATLSGLTRTDFLAVGVALLGLGLVTSALPEVIQFAGRLIWFGEASRHSQLMPIFEQSWQTLSYALLELALGIALAVKAEAVAAALDRRHRPRLRDDGASE